MSRVVVRKGMPEPGPGLAEFVAGFLLGGLLTYLLTKYRIEVRVVRRS